VGLYVRVDVITSVTNLYAESQISIFHSSCDQAFIRTDGHAKSIKIYKTYKNEKYITQIWKSVGVAVLGVMSANFCGSWNREMANSIRLLVLIKISMLYMVENAPFYLLHTF